MIHRNFEDCFSPTSNSLNTIQNLSIPLTSLPGLVSDAEVTEVTEEEFQAEQYPEFPRQPIELSPKDDVEVLLQVFKINNEPRCFRAVTAFVFAIR